MPHLLFALLLSILTIIPSFSAKAEVTVGAARVDAYLPLLEGKRVALLSNHTGMVGNEHTLDILLDNGVNVTTIFSPEHGFRGKADAGQHVADGVDAKTGIPIASLYSGKTRMPSQKVMDSIDVIVCDLQDVGTRFYTYYITMYDLMRAASIHGKDFVVLDRPNPNGMIVDGPVLDMNYKSGVGQLPIPVAHGMTLGELAMMIVGESWLEDACDLSLYVIECEGYTHSTRYQLPIPPSPNLPDMKAVYLYPSTCFFEGTPISLGRGTDWPFTIYGHPAMKGCTFSFTPRRRDGAKNPPLVGKLCHGVDLRSLSDDEIIAKGVNFEYVIDAYRRSGLGSKFFTKFFTLLTGTPTIRTMIEQGKSADEIRQSWQADIEKFRARRAPYLIYPE